MTDLKKLTAPQSELTAWTEAEAEAMRLLCMATHTTLGKNAFFGSAMNVANAWFFNNAQVYSGEVFRAPSPNQVAIPYYAEGTFLLRTDAQKWAMRVFTALPLHNSKNLFLLRLTTNGIGEIQFVNEYLQNEADAIPAYKLKLSFDLVFCMRI